MERLRFEECAKCNDYDGSIVKCFNICGKPLDALEEYNRLKDLEEQGLLLKLPCKVGDKLYYIKTLCDLHGSKIVDNCIVVSFDLRASQKFAVDSDGHRFNFANFGKTVFLTQAEAEEALKGMERENDYGKQRNLL